MDLIYYGPLFWSVIPVKDQKGFVLANTERGLGSINNKISGKIDKRPYRNFSQAINVFNNSRPNSKQTLILPVHIKSQLSYAAITEKFCIRKLYNL